MGEVEMWARLISTIKAQINPTGSDQVCMTCHMFNKNIMTGYFPINLALWFLPLAKQVATILAWEAFQEGFHNAENNPLINPPEEDTKPKKGKGMT